MIEKLTFSDAQPELTKIASRMTMIDSSTNIKSATEDTEIRRTLSDLKPTSKNHFLCHLIALGDGEHYSYNKNGDYFPKEACIKYHDTFVKNGHFFREHKNQDPKFKIGMVKASFYNHNMGRVELVIEGDRNLCPDIYDSVKNNQSRSYSMSCFPENTPVYTPNGVRNIQDLEIGDLIYSHKGTIEEVTNTIENNTDTVVEIDVGYYGKPNLKTTLEHPFYTAKITKAQRSKLANSNILSTLEDTLVFTEAKDLTDEHFLAVPLLLGNETKVIKDKNYAKFLGYILGDGSFNFCKGNPNHLQFTSNWNDILLDEIETIVESLLPGTSVRISAHNLTEQAVVLKVYSAELTRNCLAELHGFAENKMVPATLFNSDKDVVLEFFKGWINSDGWQDYKGIHISTVSHKRATDAIRLLTKNKISCSITRINHTESYNKLGINNGLEYVINIGNSYSALFAGVHSKVEIIDVAFHTSIFFTDNYCYIPVKGISIVQQSCPVYNISVANTETYNVFGIAVHNCLVPYDVSSITMKKQATLKDYDEYCKHKMGQYIPEFKKYAYVINEKPKWFDISDVAHPADRIAHFLEYKLEQDGQLAKAASAGGFISSATLASIYPLRQLEGQKLGCESSSNQEILIKLASAEEYINLLKTNSNNVCKDEKYHFVKSAASNAWGNHQLNDNQISTLRKLVPATMMTKLAKRAMFLPFESFCAVINGTKIEDTINDPVIKYAACWELPNIFKKIMSTPINQMEELFNSASDFEMFSDPHDGDVVNKLMNEAEKNFSVKPSPVKSRTITITISSSGKKPEMNEKKASFNNLTQEQKAQAANYAQAYGHYKIATIKKINELFGDNYIDLPESFLIIKQHNL